MTWIRTIAYDHSDGYLRDLYDRVKGPGGAIDNVIKAHSLRPHTLEGHVTLYKAVLHHSANQLPAWLLETLGIYTSLTNRCQYSVTHHFAGLRRILGDTTRSQAILDALQSDAPERMFAGRELALLRYARKLTTSPGEITIADIEAIRDSGVTDGELLEANQVCSYFNYSNRVLSGLGVTTEGDTLGLSPENTSDISTWRLTTPEAAHGRS